MIREGCQRVRRPIGTKSLNLLDDAVVLQGSVVVVLSERESAMCEITIALRRRRASST